MRNVGPFVPSLVPSFEEARALALTLEASVEGRFIDAMGHMNVSWYVHLFDQATWALFARLGINDDYRRRTNTGMFAVEEHVRYLSELREGDRLEVRSRLDDGGAKSVRLFHVMIDPARVRLSAVADVVGVHVDLGTRRTAPFGGEVAERIRAALPSPPAPAPLDEQRAWTLAREWVEAWNAHDLERILAHYDDDVELTSPVAAERLGDPTGVVRGKKALRAYFEGGLAAYPQLHFDLRDVMWGLSTVVLYYVNQRGSMTGELMELGATGKVVRVVANYSASRHVTRPSAL